MLNDHESRNTCCFCLCVTFTSISKIDTGEVSCVDIGTDTYISVSFESIA